MEVIKTGIYLNDEAFAKAFVRALGNVSKNIVFSIVDNADDIEGFDLFISEYPNESSHFMKIKPFENIISLTMDQQESKDEFPFLLFKYSEANQMIKDLFFIFFQITGKHVDFKENRQCRLIGIASIGGGFGATATSLAIGKAMNKLFGQRCLYMNVSTVNDSVKYTGSCTDSKLTKLVYYLTEKDGFPLSSFIGKWENVDYIDADGNWQGYNLKINKLINKAYECGKYNYFLVDMGNSLSFENLRLLEKCNCVLIIDSAKAKGCEALRDKVITQISEHSVDVPVIKVLNFATEDDSHKEEWLRVSWDEEAFILKEGTLHINTDRNYGNEIDIISKEIMEATYGKSEELIW